MASMWNALPRPLWVLAPMEDVTDTVFRRLVRRWSLAAGGPGPAVVYTEFTRVDTAARVRDAAGASAGRLRYASDEHPIAAQIWGTREDEFRMAATALDAAGFDAIDINMGCPVRKIRAHGACSALIGEPGEARRLISAVLSETSLPVSVKTRIGLDRPETERWAATLLESGIAALTVHGRTADQMSEGWADWREVAKVVRLRDRISPHTVIIGNGDVRSLAHGQRLVEQTGVDGVMFGRGIFGDPLLFAREAARDLPLWIEMPLAARMRYLGDHLTEWEATWGQRRNYEVLKKFFRNYVTPVPVDAIHDQRRDGDRASRRDGEALLAALYTTHTSAEALALLAPLADGHGTAATASLLS